MIKVKESVIPLVHDVLHSLSSAAIGIDLEQGKLQMYGGLGTLACVE
jgi:hypothetical protein